MKFQYFRVLCTLICLFYGTLNYANGELRYAAVLYRHGDRTPTTSYPLDPFQNESLWPVKFGQLTNTGKMQHFKFGQFLRQRYRYLISECFDSGEVYVRSTDMDRTLMSALSNLAGLYPPVGKCVWNEALSWQPIPIHTVPEEEDEILAMNKLCPNYDKELKRVKNDPQFIAHLNDYKNIMQYLSAHTGIDITDYYGIQSIYSILKIEDEYNFTLPQWTHAVYPDEMVKPSGYSFAVETSTAKLARLKIGPFMKQLIKNMLKTMHHHNSKIPYSRQYADVDGVDPLKLHIYSAHDLNIGSVLNGLGLYDGKCPVYTSAIFFELHYDATAQVHLVEIFYRNTTENIEPNRLIMPNCGRYCPLDKFIAAYKYLVPDDWDYECHEPVKDATWPIILCTTVALIMLFTMVHSVMYHRLYHQFERRYRRYIGEAIRTTVLVPRGALLEQPQRVIQETDF